MERRSPTSPAGRDRLPHPGPRRRAERRPGHSTEQPPSRPPSPSARGDRGWPAPRRRSGCGGFGAGGVLWRIAWGARTPLERSHVVIQHIVLLKWKPGTTDAQIDAAFAHAHELVDAFESVERVSMGRNRAQDDHGYTHALIVRLSDDHALSAYLQH